MNRGVTTVDLFATVLTYTLNGVCHSRRHQGPPLAPLSMSAPALTHRASCDPPTKPIASSRMTKQKS